MAQGPQTRLNCVYYSQRPNYGSPDRQQPSALPSGFETQGGVSGFQRSQSFPTHEITVNRFISSITRDGKHYQGLQIDSPSPNYGEWTVQFRSVQEPLNDQISAEANYLWSMELPSL
jgi:hypothetical protein